MDPAQLVVSFGVDNALCLYRYGCVTRSGFGKQRFGYGAAVSAVCVQHAMDTHLLWAATSWCSFRRRVGPLVYGCRDDACFLPARLDRRPFVCTVSSLGDRRICAEFCRVAAKPGSKACFGLVLKRPTGTTRNTQS